MSLRHSQRSSQRPAQFIASMILLCCAGCGGGDEGVPQKPAANLPAPKPIDLGPKPAPMSGIRSGTNPAEAEARRKAEEAQAREDFIKATTHPDDYFRIANDVPNFLVTGSAPPHDPDDVVSIAAVPLDREGASAFIVESDGAAGTGDNTASVRLPEGFVGLPEFGVNDKGEYLRIVCEKDQSLMALVAEGPFVLGDSHGPADARPRNEIVLDSFYIDVYEVTVGQFQAYVNFVRSEKKGLAPQPVNIADDSRMPVRGINWGEARSYAEWTGKDLPTEAEWEKAARGPRGYPHPWGYGRALWTRERELGQIDPVGAFQHDVSYYGVFDMAGNVREWCLDYYTADAYQNLAEAVPNVRRNWSGPRRSNPSNTRVVRGNGPGWTLWHRWPTETGSRPPDVGFRGVLRLKKGKDSSR